MPDPRQPSGARADALPSDLGGLLPADAAATPAGAELGAAGMEEKSLTQGQLAWRRLRRHRLAMISLSILFLIALATIFAGLVTSHSYAEQDLTLGLTRPSTDHFFGTDRLGRDQFSRVLYGGRISLAVGVGVALSSAIIGTMIGSFAGFFGGRLDNFLMRITDLFLSIPLLVVLIIASRIFGGSVLDIVIVLSLFFWMPVARIVRGVFLSLREKEFVEAARAAGASNRRIIFRHLLPNSMGPIIVNLTLSVAAAILIESTLSFLGFGVQPPTPTWGNMLADGRVYIQSAPWLIWFPGAMILVTVLSVNFLGDGLRDALDPTQQRVRA